MDIIKKRKWWGLRNLEGSCFDVGLEMTPIFARVVASASVRHTDYTRELEINF